MMDNGLNKVINRLTKGTINYDSLMTHYSLKAQTHLQHWLLIIITFGIKAQIFINLSLLAFA